MLSSQACSKKWLKFLEPFQNEMARALCLGVTGHLLPKSPAGLHARRPLTMSDFTSPRSFLRQIDLSSLDLFVLICECGSIARAAEQGGMVASAVSKRVAELESLARTPLLLRHARGVRPTPAGELLLAHAARFFLGSSICATTWANMRAAYAGWCVSVPMPPPWSSFCPRILRSS